MKSTPHKANLLSPANASFYSWNWFQELLLNAEPYLSDQGKYVTIFSYLNGKKVEYPREEILRGVREESEEDFCNKFPSSFRLTNIQVLDEDVRRLCDDLSAVFKRPVSCNLYFTPGEDRNCFDYHSDFQETYILQLRGMKEWAFPFKENQEFIKNIEGEIFPKDKFRENEEKILLTSAEQLYVPYAVAHKVEIKGSGSSIHLTFSTYEKTRQELINIFFQELLSSSDFSLTKFEKLRHDEIGDRLNELKEAALSLNIDELSKKIANKFFADDLEFSKFGRSYSGKNKSSLD